MENRVNISKSEPEAYKAMLEMEKYAQALKLPILLKELIKIRASQLNGCAYCLDMHTEEAIAAGESSRKIFALSAWKESHLFTASEKAVLQLTEEVTVVAEKGISAETQDKLRTFYTDQEISQIIMQVIVINSWNRIAIAGNLIYKK